MRLLILAAALGAVAIPATAANAQYWRGGYDYNQRGYGHNQRDVRQEQRECRRELRRAQTRRQYLRELRECRREIAMARRGNHDRGRWDRSGYGYRNDRDRHRDGYRGRYDY